MSTNPSPADAGKLSVSEVHPKALRGVSDAELLSMNRRMHQLYGRFFEGNRNETADGMSREDLINATVFLWREMLRREMTVSRNTPLYREVRRFVGELEKATKPKPVLCFYHRDLDGIASAAVVARKYGADHVDLVSINYGEELDEALLEGRMAVLMVDFGLQPFSGMVKLKAKLDKQATGFIWIDHHASALKDAEEVGFEAEGLRRIGKAGCELTWKYLFPDEPMPEAVRLAGRFDVWDHSDPNVLPVHYAMEASAEAHDPAGAWWKKWLKAQRADFAPLIAEGKAIEKWLVRFNEGNASHTAFPVKFHGLDCIAMCTVMPGSKQFDSVRLGYDAAISFHFEPKGQWHVSMYALKQSVDVGSICAEHGGGGHKGAAGFQCKRLPFDLPKKRATADINPGSGATMPPLKPSDVTQHVKPIVLRSPFVTLVGSICNQGETHNDVDLLVHGPLDPAMRQVVEFRLGRMLPEEKSARAQFHDESLGGPFTDHINLFDLVMVPRQDLRTIVRMQEEIEVLKQSDPAMDWPKQAGPHDSVVQIHSRGKSIHTDLRFRMNGHLIGWTLFSQTAGTAPDINTISQLRQMYAGWTAKEGNRYLKPLLAPAKQQAGGKLRQPIEWLNVSGKVIGEGEIGATSHEEGVIVAIARPKAEWGLQIPHFHEYFLTGDRQWQGPLYFRLLLGEGAGERRTPEGKPFWTTWLSKNALPSVLKTSSVRKGHMPPKGRSAIPRTLEQVTPKEFRYWEAGTEREAKEVRDALVKERYFTEANVDMVDGQFRRTVTKRYLYVLDDDRPRTDAPPEGGRGGGEGGMAEGPGGACVCPSCGYSEPHETGETCLRPCPACGAEMTRKADSRRYTLSWLYWRGPMQVRVGPSRQVWLLMLDDPGGGLEAWELTSNPIGTDAPTTAVERPLKGKGLLAADQRLEPGESIDGNVLNDTKDTPATIRPLLRGTVEVVERKPGFVRLRFNQEKLRGDWTLTREEEGTKIWVLEPKPDARKAVDPFVGIELRKYHCLPPGIAMPVLKKLTEAEQADYDRETARIAENAKKPEAKQWHIFQPAKWTHPNGHPRCLVCGDEERIGSICNPTRAEQTLALRRTDWHDAVFQDDAPTPTCEYRYKNRRVCGKDCDRVFIESSGYRRPLCRKHMAETIREEAKKRQAKADGDSDAPSRADLKPGQRFRPMKPKGGADIGEFRDVEPLLEKWLPPERLKLGVYVEPKWNGIRVVASRDADAPEGKRVSIWFEDAKDERAKILPGVAKALDAVPGSWIADAELLDHDEDGTVLPRSSLGRFTGDVDPQDDSRVTFNVHRILFWSESGGVLTHEDEDQQDKTVAAWFRKARSKHLVRTPRKLVRSKDELRRAVEWARGIDGSEGAMLKLTDATYSLGGQTSSWAKLKTIRRIHALVYARDRVAGSTRTWNFQCAVGPIKESDGFDPKETVEHGGKLWAIIGNTANSNVQARPGDIIQAQVFELQVNTAEGKRRVHWFGPPTVELLRDDLKNPMTVKEIEALATESEIRKLLAKLGGQVIPLFKTERSTEEERFVLGVVLEPNDGDDGAPLDPDTQRDVYSKAEVRGACHLFMERFQNVGHMHRRLVNRRVKIVECYLAPTTFELMDPYGEKRVVREGTWLLGLHVVDKALWGKVKADELTGLSIGGSARRLPQNVVALDMGPWLGEVEAEAA